MKHWSATAHISKQCPMGIRMTGAVNNCNALVCANFVLTMRVSTFQPVLRAQLKVRAVVDRFWRGEYARTKLSHAQGERASQSHGPPHRELNLLALRPISSKPSIDAGFTIATNAA
jgi:hypothetical protein